MSSRRGAWVLGGLLALLLVATIAPWLIWGEALEGAFSPQGTLVWLRAKGEWAGVAGIGLLVADVALPIPGTVVMSALGATYGTFIGGLLAAFGSTLAGTTAYGLARWAGRPAARWLAGDHGLDTTESLFAEKGAWLVVSSRWMPILPEAVACLAGLARMPFGTFLGALLIGSLPLGFAFAWIGTLAEQREGWAIGLSAGLPIGAWMLARRWRRG
jgi:uncharacterized membrane protein YdjX (TVP38/TMEM64 family)